jgi:hypothetical protein
MHPAIYKIKASNLDYNLVYKTTKITSKNECREKKLTGCMPRPQQAHLVSLQLPKMNKIITARE